MWSLFLLVFEVSCVRGVGLFEAGVSEGLCDPEGFLVGVCEDVFEAGTFESGVCKVDDALRLLGTKSFIAGIVGRITWGSLPVALVWRVVAVSVTIGEPIPLVSGISIRADELPDVIDDVLRELPVDRKGIQFAVEYPMCSAALPFDGRLRVEFSVEDRRGEVTVPLKKAFCRRSAEENTEEGKELSNVEEARVVVTFSDVKQASVSVHGLEELEMGAVE